MKVLRRSILALGLVLCVSCASEATRPESSTASHATAAGGTRLFEGLDLHLRDVTTTSEDAQRWFDQGLVLMFGFNYGEASRSFARAAELDPDCAMAWWGVALAAGPHINNPTMDEAASKAAFESISKARAVLDRETPVERALVDALSKRYVESPPADRKALDEAYASAMRDVWHSFPHDADVGALFAEAMMDLRPWDLWTPQGVMQPGTDEILATLAAARTLSPRHPGVNHYLVHSWEASPTPERALEAANTIRELVPGAGHLVHMPSHIDVRLGHYADAVSANQRAVAADRRYIDAGGVRGFNDVYRAHNFHFLQYAAMFEGRSALALQAARDVVATIPIEAVLELPQFLEGFQGAPYHALVRFGRWDEILREREPDSRLRSATAMHHYARGLAFAATNRVDDAQRELAAFDEACALVPEDWFHGNNPTRTVLAVGRPMLAGEIAYRRGEYDRAFELLAQAVQRDEALHYDEPWGWMMPASHALGALLLEQGRVAQAEAVYRADLARHRENGWALHGLAECLRRSGRETEAKDVEQRFERVWQRADVVLPGSCFCRTGKRAS